MEGTELDVRLKWRFVRGQSVSRIPREERVCNEEVLRKMGTEKDTYTYCQKETFEITWTHNEKRGLKEFNPHRTYWKLEKQKLVNNKSNKFV